MAVMATYPHAIPNVTENRMVKSTVDEANSVLIAQFFKMAESE
jgi:hypothetical protein